VISLQNLDAENHLCLQKRPFLGPHSCFMKKVCLMLNINLRCINIRSMSQFRKMAIALYNMDMMRTTPMSTMMRTMHQKRPFLGPQLYFMIKSLLPFNAWYKKTYSGLLVY
jgi:hypothetical protein